MTLWIQKEVREAANDLRLQPGQSVSSVYSKRRLVSISVYYVDFLLVVRAN